MTGMVNSGTGSEPFDPSIHGRASHAQLHTFRHNRFMQGLALPFVTLAEMNPQHARLILVFHC
jgi:hypothetical protein